MSAAASPELEITSFFRKLYYSPRYSQYLGPRLGRGAMHCTNSLDAWYGLCNEFRKDLQGEAIPAFWDSETKTALVCSVPKALNKLNEGYVLIGFATISSQSKSHVLRAKPLPIFVDVEIATVIEVIEKAKAS